MIGARKQTVAQRDPMAGWREFARRYPDRWAQWLEIVNGEEYLTAMLDFMAPFYAKAGITIDELEKLGQGICP